MQEGDFGYRLVEPCTEVDVDSREVVIMSICLEKVAEKYTDREQGAGNSRIRLPLATISLNEPPFS